MAQDRVLPAVVLAAIAENPDVPASVESQTGEAEVGDLDEDDLSVEGLLDSAQWVTFVSITDRQAAQRLLDSALTPTTYLHRVEDRDDLFIGRDRKDRSIALTIRTLTDDVFLGEGDCSRILDELSTLSTHSTGFKPLSERHDAMATLQLRSLPVATRQRFSDRLWHEAAPSLQRRDEEPDQEFTYREATTRTLVDLIDLGVRGVNEVTLTGDIDEAKRSARVEVRVDAVTESDLSQRLSTLVGQPSMFLPLHDPEAALSVSLSLQLTEFERGLLTRWIRCLNAVVRVGEDDEPAIVAAMLTFLSGIQATIDAGQIDFFGQWEIQSAREFGIVGGLRLHHSALSLQGLRALGDDLQKSIADDPSANEGVRCERHTAGDLERLHVTHADEFTLADGEQSDLDICVGVGRGAFWFCGGSLNSVARLDAAFERMDETAPRADPARSAPPFLLTARAAPWQLLPLTDDFDERLQRQLAEQAFHDADALRVELRPTKRGAVFDMQIETGFLRWLALVIATEYDANQL